MCQINNIYRILEQAKIDCSSKVRILINDGYEKNSRQIKHTVREQKMYSGFIERIHKFQINLMNEIERNGTIESDE